MELAEFSKTNQIKNYGDNGNIVLNNASISGNGNVMTFDSDSVRNNKIFISSAYKAENRDKESRKNCL